MNKYIKQYNQLNESFKQHGIVLIKGKTKGKNKEPMLYATHVNSTIEIRPGATMLILSDTFYRVVKGDSGKLKGVKINWREEESLKDSLNFKSPGRLSVVKNNNKTPYHWKTLKYTNLPDALSAVEQDINDHSYVFESENYSDSDLINTLVSDAINSIFLGTDDSVIVLSSNIPEDIFSDSISSADYGEDDSETDWVIELDCLYIGRPELDSELKSVGKRRFTLMLDLYTHFSFNVFYDSRNDDAHSEITSVSTTINGIYLDDEEIENEPSTQFTKLLSDSDPDDIRRIINKNTQIFIKL